MKENLKKQIEHLITLKRELLVLKGLEELPKELKQRCLDYYNREISEMLEDPYIYDKYYGMLQGGII